MEPIGLRENGTGLPGLLSKEKTAQGRFFKALFCFR